MIYALTVVWFEYRRYLPAVMVVAAATALTAMLVGILIGLVALASTPVDRSIADIWVTARGAPAVDMAAPISRNWINHLMCQPGVTGTDELLITYGNWNQPGRGAALVTLIGLNLGSNSLGPVGSLTPEQRLLLSETGAVIIDAGERDRLGVKEIGHVAEIGRKRVHVVGFTRGIPSLTGSFVFCSLQTARAILASGSSGFNPDQTMFLLARCEPEAIPGVIQGMAPYADVVTTRSADEFSRRSRMFWVTTTKAGLTVFFITVMGFIVAVSITGQTLYAATQALARELALLRALGAPLTRLARFVLQQAALVGVAGVLIGLILIEVLTYAAGQAGAPLFMDWRLRSLSMVVTLVMVMVAGIVALLSLRRTGPMELLR